ncbi:MAG: CP12 domain-containing protein [Vulcanococcus sp.]
MPDPNSTRSLDAHLASLRSELEQARQSGNQAKANHLEGELKDLEAYKAHHPEASQDPTPLEVYCDLNPQAPECLVYDD